MFIEAMGKAVSLNGKPFVPIRFNTIVPKEDFTALCHTVLYGNECIYSKPIKKWFCPEGEIRIINHLASAFMEDRGIDVSEGADELGDQLARLYGKE